MQYVAHASKSKPGQPPRWQLLTDHLESVAQLAYQYGQTIGVGHIAELAGLFHDAGKFSEEFQTYLRKAVEDPDSVQRGSVDHSTLGGKLLFEYLHDQDNTYQRLAEVVGDAIISHHSGGGLLDFLDPADGSHSDDKARKWEPYIGRVEIKELENYEQTKQVFTAEIGASRIDELIEQALTELKQWDDLVDKQDPYQMGADPGIPDRRDFLLMKFIYSCLIDADRTDTVCFETQGVPKKYETHQIFTQYYQNLTTKLDEMSRGKNSDSSINQLRRQMSQECDDFANRSTGTYLLSIPTGGGKTLASLRFALKHATNMENGKNEKQRIIYIVPYTTIIEQNAATIRHFLNGNENDTQNILEFHSGMIHAVDPDKDNSDDLDENQWQLAQDSWDSPIILTTLVQFLNVFYADGTRSIRRLHNLSNSVIIFDEVQNVPTKCVAMFNSAVNFLQKYMNTTCILCTATQPALNQVKQGLTLSKQAQMISDLPNVVDQFQRVNLIDRTTENWTIQKLAEFTIEQRHRVGNVLVIVNTKSAARQLYAQITTMNDAEEVFHLSTSMCPAHRRQQLKLMTERLRNKEPTICISTQLIEAGVDISFACVIRSAAGLDSIAQAAGRCNRNGEVARQNVYIVKMNSTEENVSRLREIQVGRDILLGMLQQVDDANELFQGPKITSYFDQFYRKFVTELEYPIHDGTHLYRLMDGHGTKQAICNANKQIEAIYASSSKTIAKHFNVIDDLTETVLVPFRTQKEIEDGDAAGKAEQLITELNGDIEPVKIPELLKQSQQYSINLYQQDMRELVKNNLIYPLQNGELYAIRSGAYNSEGSGLDVSGSADPGPSIF